MGLWLLDEAGVGGIVAVTAKLKEHLEVLVTLSLIVADVLGWASRPKGGRKCACEVRHRAIAELARHAFDVVPVDLDTPELCIEREVKSWASFLDGGLEDAPLRRRPMNVAVTLPSCDHKPRSWPMRLRPLLMILSGLAGSGIVSFWV